MNATQIPFVIPNVTASKMIESFQSLQRASAPAGEASRRLSLAVTSKQINGREATIIDISLTYLGGGEISYIYEGHFVNDVVVNQTASYKGLERDFRSGDIGLFNEAVVVETI